MIYYFCKVLNKIVSNKECYEHWDYEKHKDNITSTRAECVKENANLVKVDSKEDNK